MLQFGMQIYKLRGLQSEVFHLFVQKIVVCKWMQVQRRMHKCVGIPHVRQIDQEYLDSKLYYHCPHQKGLARVGTVLWLCKNLACRTTVDLHRV